MFVWRQAAVMSGWLPRVAGLTAAAFLAVGCASPGPPKAPSLQLPELVTKLQATRRAGVVELEFAVPVRTTDGVAYRGTSVKARVCRAVETGMCVPVPALSGLALPVPAGAATNAAGTPGTAPTAPEPEATLKDALPDSLRMGPARLLTYRVELSNERGKTAGFGDAAFAAAGASPAAVTGLRAEGSRRGVAVRWAPEGGAGDVVLRRELVSGVSRVAGSGAGAAGPGAARPAARAGKRKDSGSRAGRVKPAQGAVGKEQAKEQPGVVWLSTVPESDPLATSGTAQGPGLKNTANGVVDDGAQVGGTYRYAAERREMAQFGGHTVVLHGELSAPVEVTLKTVYPPPAPTDLVGTVFPMADGAGLAVDLIWTPADDPGTTGYKVFREVGGVRTVVTKEPVRVPAFHDVLPAALAGSLRYGVVAVDGRGMESAAVVTVVTVDRR